MSEDYTLAFEVEAATELDAIAKATAMLRTGVYPIAVQETRLIKAAEGPDGWKHRRWRVSMKVWED